ncbi:metal-dependent phosphohydrolase HD domain-containing protein [Cardiosporidium cionae]|uniref:Metal-dependent phosphohydrolase HD domain-containing protein n=1 Tax=Cardiosporidium cionae TaxID=476202 RepID=A0ABQ7JFQ3_9APIC|nr:metal-dependent phosphohydrolase HD domain-containing protein [Cardiosporidium cionae]|eukprot:KAF8822856.1 metal-dependent phosphohydrolase HD domain-containing protein [Cardiosporidium cionae]
MEVPLLSPVTLSATCKKFLEKCDFQEKQEVEISLQEERLTEMDYVSALLWDPRNTFCLAKFVSFYEAFEENQRTTASSKRDSTFSSATSGDAATPGKRQLSRNSISQLKSNESRQLNIPSMKNEVESTLPDKLNLSSISEIETLNTFSNPPPSLLSATPTLPNMKSALLSQESPFSSSPTFSSPSIFESPNKESIDLQSLPLSQIRIPSHAMPCTTKVSTLHPLLGTPHTQKEAVLSSIHCQNSTIFTSNEDSMALPILIDLLDLSIGDKYRLFKTLHRALLRKTSNEEKSPRTPTTSTAAVEPTDFPLDLLYELMYYSRHYAANDIYVIIRQLRIEEKLKIKDILKRISQLFYSAGKPFLKRPPRSTSLSSHSAARTDKDRKEVSDRVHLTVAFDRWIFDNIIDSHYFQRLRYLCQLGACKYVYPGATHTRFEHSLGVGQLARELFKKLAAKFNFSCQYGETARLLKCVQIAGLCHDLGHGPYSHTFENYFINYRKPVEEHWSHETMSLCMVDELVGPLIDKGEFDLDDSDLKAIKHMIQGISPSFNSVNGWDSLGSLMRVAFDIVANKRNGLDVDKFDYLRRDASLIFPGANIPLLDSYRLLNHCAVIDGEIVYNIQDLQAVWMVYFNRYSLNSQIYTHRKVRALELMLCDSFRLVDDIFHWSSAVNTVEEILDLTDVKLIWEEAENVAEICRKDKFDNVLY